MTVLQKSLLLLLPLLVFQIVSAHPGRTASDGCHYCRSNCDSWGVAWNERHCDGTSSPAPSGSYVPVSESEGSARLFSEFDAGVLEAEATTRFMVVEVVDGDTIKVRDRDGGVETIRLIGIDTPETVHPSKPVECFGKEASARLRELVEGKEVALVKDEVGDTIDRYGRHLRYVVLDGEDMNARMVLDGYAYAYTKYPFDHAEIYTEAQRRAREQGRGLWADGVCEDDERKAGVANTTASGGGALPAVPEPAEAAPAARIASGGEGGQREGEGSGLGFLIASLVVAALAWSVYRSRAA